MQFSNTLEILHPLFSRYWPLWQGLAKEYLENRLCFHKAKSSVDFKTANVLD